MKNTILWIGALVVGAIMGLLGISWLNEVMNFVATVYMRLFQLLAVPTIVLAVITTFATFGQGGEQGVGQRTPEESARPFGALSTTSSITFLVYWSISDAKCWQ